MIIPCFRRQIQTLFSLGAYKATGTLLPCSCQPYEPKHGVRGKLTYKIDIAHQLYRYYEQESFKYTEKGVTPRMIAEETAIYTHESPHLTLEIDSFGYLLVSPTDLYLRELKENLVSTRKVSHYPIEVRDMRWKDIGIKPQGVIMNLSDLSLTSLRVAFTLDLICRKKVLMGECSPEAISRLIDVSQMTEFQVQELLESRLFGLEGPNTQVKTRKSLQLNSSGVKIVKEFQPASPGEWLGGCERHYTIPFFKQYRHLLEEEDHLLKFGSIVPNISLSQLKQLSPQHFKQEYWKLMRYSLGFDPHLPINLKEPLPLPVFQNSLGKTMGNRPGMEQVLMLLDQLGNNQVGQCYYWLISWLISRQRFQGDKGQEEVWALLRDLLSLLVDLDH